jgi:hypothetical protein
MEGAPEDNITENVSPYNTVFGYDPKEGLDAKTHRLADHQSQTDWLCCFFTTPIRLGESDSVARGRRLDEILCLRIVS